MNPDRKKIWSWALYDWANSAFAVTVMAGFFPVFFENYWSTTDDVNESTFYLGVANSIASIIVAALAPFLGAIADKGGLKKKFLILFAYLGIIMTGALWLVQKGDWQLAALFYIIASVGFMGGNIFYDALLVSVAPREKYDYVSSLGFSLGYIGGGLLFLLNVVMFQKPELFGLQDAAAAVRLSFLSVALWWAVFSIPIMIFVKEPKNKEQVSTLRAIKLGWKQLRSTIRDLKHLKVVGLFLAAYWLYIDGVDTIIRMAVKYGTSLGFSSTLLITALLLVQFIAFPAALVYYWFASKVGLKKAILIGIGAYGLITIFGFYMKYEWHFYILAIMVAFFQGGIQALSRSLYARIIPPGKAGEFFGFYNMLGKMAAIIGPPLMGIVGLLTGNPRYGILSIIILFILGAYLFNKVDVEKGEKMALKYLAKDM